MPTNVLVVDSHDDIRRLFVVWLEGEDGIHVVGGARNCDDAIGLLGKMAADAVLLDVDMPDTEAVNAIRKLKAAFSDICVVAMSWDLAPGRLARILDAGAHAMFDKAQKLEGLIGVIHQCFE